MRIANSTQRCFMIRFWLLHPSRLLIGSHFLYFKTLLPIKRGCALLFTALVQSVCHHTQTQFLQVRFSKSREAQPSRWPLRTRGKQNLVFDDICPFSVRAIGVTLLSPLTRRMKKSKAGLIAIEAQWRFYSRLPRNVIGVYTGAPFGSLLHLQHCVPTGIR